LHKILIDFEHPRGTVEWVEINNETWLLHGECNRCGVCCEQIKMPFKPFRRRNGGCNRLSYEILDGERVACCSEMWCRPAFCVFYPRDPYDPLPDNCSFRWEKING